MIGALTLLLLFQLAGEILAHELALPLPGPVIGMALLFATLALRGRVVESGRRVYCRDELTRVAFESETLSRYHDYKPELENLVLGFECRSDELALPLRVPGLRLDRRIGRG